MSDPTIYCFVRGTWNGDLSVMAMAEDGTILAAHISSNESFAKLDIGIGSMRKHHLYAAHYPNGYRLEWVGNEDHAGLNAAIDAAQAKAGKDV